VFLYLLSGTKQGDFFSFVSKLLQGMGHFMTHFKRCNKGKSTEKFKKICPFEVLITLYVAFDGFNSCKISSFLIFLPVLSLSNIWLSPTFEFYLWKCSVCICIWVFLLVMSWIILWNWNNNYKLFVTWLIKIILNTFWTVIQHSILPVSEPLKVESNPARQTLVSQ